MLMFCVHCRLLMRHCMVFGQ